jgi:TolA-binding protein
MTAYPKRARLDLFCLITIVATLTACAETRPTPSDQTGKVDILERRIFVLEQDRQRTLTELNEQLASIKREISVELENFRRSQRFFLEEMNRLKEDLALLNNDTEIAGRQLRIAQRRIESLMKRVGNQAIELDTLRKFFDDPVDPAPAVQGPERQAFDAAFDAYRSKNLDEALTLFTAFRSNFPKSDLADHSLFMIGYIVFVQGDYESASLRFFELLRLYPESTRRQETRWWLGVALERSGDINSALIQYRELTKLPPSDPLRIKAEFRLQEISPDDSPGIIDDP